MYSSLAARSAVLVAIAGTPGPGAWGAQALGYDQLVSKAQADLGIGRAAKALRESKGAIAIASRHWQADVVAGGALQLQGNFRQAINELSKSHGACFAGEEARHK